MWPIKERYLDQTTCPRCGKEAGPCESVTREWSDGRVVQTNSYHFERDSTLSFARFVIVHVAASLNPCRIFASNPCRLGQRPDDVTKNTHRPRWGEGICAILPHLQPSPIHPVYDPQTY